MPKDSSNKECKLGVFGFHYHLVAVACIIKFLNGHEEAEEDVVEDISHESFESLLLLPFLLGHLLFVFIIIFICLDHGVGKIFH